jgi:hypothetical protein
VYPRTAFQNVEKHDVYPTIPRGPARVDKNAKMATTIFDMRLELSKNCGYLIQRISATPDARGCVWLEPYDDVVDNTLQVFDAAGRPLTFGLVNREVVTREPFATSAELLQAQLADGVELITKRGKRVLAVADDGADAEVWYPSTVLVQDCNFESIKGKKCVITKPAMIVRTGATEPVVLYVHHASRGLYWTPIYELKIIEQTARVERFAKVSNKVRDLNVERLLLLTNAPRVRGATSDLGVSTKTNHDIVSVMKRGVQLEAIEENPFETRTEAKRIGSDESTLSYELTGEQVLPRGVFRLYLGTIEDLPCRKIIRGVDDGYGRDRDAHGATKIPTTVQFQITNTSQTTIVESDECNVTLGGTPLGDIKMPWMTPGAQEIIKTGQRPRDIHLSYTVSATEEGSVFTSQKLPPAVSLNLSLFVEAQRTRSILNSLAWRLPDSSRSLFHSKRKCHEIRHSTLFCTASQHHARPATWWSCSVF